MNNVLNSYHKGKHAEDAACRFLEHNGLKLLYRNYRIRSGEIDLVMRDHEIIVFIEVRARAGKQVVSALETIDPGKCRRIIKAGNHFLQKYRLGNSTFFRFDVVILQGEHGDYEIDWIRNAFET